MMSAMTTIARPKLPTLRQIVRRARAIGWTQNSLARRAGKDGGYVAGMSSGRIHSPGVHEELLAALTLGEETAGVEPKDPGPKYPKRRR